MNVLVVLLRGINVGGNNILPMKELSSLLIGMGFTEVKTYIQSGNVVMQSTHSNAKLVATDIASVIEKSKGFKPDVMVLSAKQFADAIDGSPFQTNDGKTLHYFFLSGKVKSVDLSLLENIKSATEEYALLGSVFYLYAPDGIGRSKLVTKIDKALGVSVTGRNWNTVKKLATLAGV